MTRQKRLWRSATVLLAVMVFTFVSYAIKNSASEIPNMDGTVAIEPLDTVLPFAEIQDVSGSFTEGDVEFLEGIKKGELICSQIKSSEYAQADEMVNIHGKNSGVMILHCTWASAARTMYIGFINEKGDEVYALHAAGGSLAGKLNLDSIPDGNYYPIMYSDNNENVNAAMLYQFQYD